MRTECHWGRRGVDGVEGEDDAGERGDAAADGGGWCTTTVAT